MVQVSIIFHQRLQILDICDTSHQQWALYMNTNQPDMRKSYLTCDGIIGKLLSCLFLFQLERVKGAIIFYPLSLVME